MGTPLTLKPIKYTTNQSSMDLQFTLDFLSDLATHNKKEWMDENKKRYNQAKNFFVELVAEVINESASFDKSLIGLDPKKTLFRINRDVRFSKNKDPYKTSFSAAIVEGGRKSGNPGYYIQLMPGNSLVGGGLHEPDPPSLQRVRQEIDFNGESLLRITTKPDFVNLYNEPYGEKLKSAPKGYLRDHEYIELLRLKDYVFMNQISDKEVTSKNVVRDTVNSLEALYPLNQFLREALS